MRLLDPTAARPGRPRAVSAVGAGLAPAGGPRTLRDRAGHPRVPSGPAACSSRAGKAGERPLAKGCGPYTVMGVLQYVNGHGLSVTRMLQSPTRRAPQVTSRLSARVTTQIARLAGLEIGKGQADGWRFPASVPDAPPGVDEPARTSPTAPARAQALLFRRGDVARQQQRRILQRAQRENHRSLRSPAQGPATSATMRSRSSTSASGPSPTMAGNRQRHEAPATLAGAKVSRHRRL